jgi:hypothetical protein
MDNIIQVPFYLLTYSPWLNPIELLWLRHHGLGTSDHARLQSGFDQFHAMAIGTLDGAPKRQAMAVRQQAPFGLELAAIGGILANLFPPSGAWVIAQSLVCHSHSRPIRVK